MEEKETRVVCTYNVSSITESIQICDNTIAFTSMEVDGTEVTLATGYTFDTIGEHTVKFTLKDNTTMSNNAFYYCTGLTSVDIPDSVTSIGNNAFYYCTGLTSVDIPDSVTSIGNNAFQRCKGLTSVTLGNGVTNIGESTFNNCYTITSIVIPSGVTNIGNGAFSGCYELSSITYTGTVAQWKAINKATDWHENAPATTVTCTDGTCGLDDTTA